MVRNASNKSLWEVIGRSGIDFYSQALYRLQAKRIEIRTGIKSEFDRFAVNLGAVQAYPLIRKNKSDPERNNRNSQMFQQIYYDRSKVTTFHDLSNYYKVYIKTIHILQW